LKGIGYRPEIDGLRAIAVAVVVAFHAELGLAPGGYIGVDVFFVISGYLITSLIVADVEAGRFSILSFYERRIRRIFPALLAVVAVCLVVGYWRLTPDDFVLLGRNALAALGFHSNYWLAGHSGYFMPTSYTLPLNHTWSLGV
jgi:peptidoglycan/LPS O-acetylase OafA/YrhL